MNRVSVNVSALVAACAVLFAAALSPTTAYAYVISGTAASEVIIIGYANPTGGPNYDQAVACVGGTAYPLRSDALTTNALNRDIEIRAEGGHDTILFVRTSNYNPGVSYGCGDSTWNPITSFSSWELDMDGRVGTDVMEGANGSLPMTMYADGTGSALDTENYMWGYSSVIEMLGSHNPDHIIADTAGGSEILTGNNAADCLYDISNSFSSFNCGDAYDHRHLSNTGTTACELTTDCCGLC